MQNQLLEFTNDANQSIHIEMIEGNPWFLAKDVCDILGHTNTTVAMRMLDDDEYLTYDMFRAGQKRKANFVSESGFYHLTFTSKVSGAKKFRKWVTSVVLPEIRKTGSYCGRNYKRTECYTSKGYIAKGFFTGYIDYRTCLHGFTEVDGYELKTLQYEGQTWICIRNFLQVIKNNTTTGQWAAHLNARNVLAKTFWLFGETTPAWFTTADGLHLIKLAARKTSHAAAKIEIPFPCTLPTQLTA